MKRFCRTAAFVLVFVMLFSASAAADHEISGDIIGRLKAASAGTSVTSGAVFPEGSPGAAEAADSAENADAEASPSDQKAEEGEYIKVTKFGNEGDVMIGGLEIHAGRWYTVIDGELTEAPPWPDSYLYYSHSQSKITLHEFHYRIPSDKIGRDDTFAALYIPTDMHIVLEGENELINGGYSQGGVSNGVYARDCAITFEGNGTLMVNTRSDEGMTGYGVYAGRTRLAGEFVGLGVYGRSGAFRYAPYTTESREMAARRADLHPEYNGGVTVRDANPYDASMFTRNPYVMIAVGDKLSPEQEMRARVEAEYYATRADYDEACDNAWDETLTEFNRGMDEFYAEAEQWQAEASTVTPESWEEDTAGFDLAQMMINGGF